MQQSWVYIMGNNSGRSLYIGVTNDLRRRVLEHKNGTLLGFTNKYRCVRLLYSEEYQDIRDAIAREKQLKGWLRSRKEALIAQDNPERRDLAEDWY